MIVRNIFEAYFLGPSLMMGGGGWLLVVFSDAWDGLTYVGFMSWVYSLEKRKCAAPLSIHSQPSAPSQEKQLQSKKENSQQA